MNFAIVLAAGTGSRFGKAVLKQRARLAGKAVYEHTLERLQSIAALAGILVVTNEDLPERAPSDEEPAVPRNESEPHPSGSRSPEQWKAQIAAQNPIGRVLEPSDVTPLVLLLASPLSAATDLSNVFTPIQVNCSMRHSSTSLRMRESP